MSKTEISVPDCVVQLAVSRAIGQDVCALEERTDAYAVVIESNDPWENA